jgi:hypothetical protein
MLPHLTACMLTLLAVAHTSQPVCEKNNLDLPVVFDIDGMPFAILKEPSQFQFLPCFPDETRTVFLDMSNTYHDQVGGWIEKYGAGWKYVHEEEEMYNWFALHLPQNPSQISLS